jgi:hypothetical protein
LIRKGRAGSSPAIGTKNLSGERLLDLIQKPFSRFKDEERLGVIGKSLRDAVDFYELHLKSQDSLRQINLEPFVREFLKAKEEGKTPARKGAMRSHGSTAFEISSPSI